MEVSWKDWWASRTIRFNAYMITIMTTLMPTIVLLDEHKLTSLGLSSRSVTVIVISISLLSALWNNKLRSITTKPLIGRSSTGDGYLNPEDENNEAG